jgi:hypothetical protein
MRWALSSISPSCSRNRPIHPPSRQFEAIARRCHPSRHSKADNYYQGIRRPAGCRHDGLCRHNWDTREQPVLSAPRTGDWSAIGGYRSLDTPSGDGNCEGRTKFTWSATWAPYRISSTHWRPPRSDRRAALLGAVGASSLSSAKSGRPMHRRFRFSVQPETSYH